MYLRLTQTCLVTHTFALPLTTTVQAGNNLSSSSEFARLKQLMKLSVALNNFPNASGLSALTRLTSLYIQHNNLDNAALAEIAKTLPSLFELQIQYNPRITSLGALATMPELMFVDAGHTNVTRQASNTKISTFLDGTAYCDGAYTSNSKVQCTPCCCSATRYDCATYMYGPPFNSYSSTLVHSGPPFVQPSICFTRVLSIAHLHLPRHYSCVIDPDSKFDEESMAGKCACRNEMPGTCSRNADKCYTV